MTIFRFLFGHGWWTLWHVAFHLVLLVFVVMVLLMFAQDLKPRGAKPDPPSPASIMVLMIALGLAFLTLVDGFAFLFATKAPMWIKLLGPVIVAFIVGAALFPLNIALATRQTPLTLWLNVIVAAAFVLLNLIMLWLVETRGAGVWIDSKRTLLVAAAIALACAVSFAVGVSLGDPSKHERVSTASS